MASKKRGRADAAADSVAVKKAARGASPNPKASSTHMQSMSYGTEYDFSYPTIPEPHDFGSAASMRVIPDAPFFFPSQHPYQGQTAANMHSDLSMTVSAQASVQASPYESSYPSAANLTNQYLSEDLRLGSDLGKTTWVWPPASCRGDSCTGRQCQSCDSSCYEPCLNPDECSSATCRNLSCFGSPMPSSLNPYTPSQELYGQPENNLLTCDWLGNGVHCQQPEADKNQLSAHVLESHIKPQAQVTCRWDDCGISTDVRSLPNHIWSHHEPESYVCLWANCTERFKTHEELDNHFKLVHCNVGCHWAGCEMVTMSQVELQNHFQQEHLDTYNTQDTTMRAYTIFDPIQHMGQSGIVQGSQSTRDHAFHSENGQEKMTRSNSHVDGEMLGPKVCKWIKNGIICQSVHEHGNKLQEHIKENHNPVSSPQHSKKLKCGWDGCKFVESSGDKSKLWRHVAIHTKCRCRVAFNLLLLLTIFTDAFVSCRCCRKEYSDKHRLEDHLRKASKTRRLECEKCGQTFSHQHALSESNSSTDANNSQEPR